LREAERGTKQVKEFQEAHPELRPVREDSEKWTSVSRGLEADYESSEAIGDRFNSAFTAKVAWVESWRDRRGRITATCSVNAVGEFELDLSWRSSSIQPLLSDPSRPNHYDAFSQGGHEVMEWAASRIQPILDKLKARLEELCGGRFRGLYVFGSYARPDAGIKLPLDSDLDMAVLLSDVRDVGEEIDRFGHITAALSLKNDLVILIPIRESDFREGRTNFARVILEYAVPVE
jgi:predicted nucleotidyltransferase